MCNDLDLDVLFLNSINIDSIEVSRHGTPLEHTIETWINWCIYIAQSLGISTFISLIWVKEIIAKKSLKFNSKFGNKKDSEGTEEIKVTTSLLWLRWTA